MIDARPIEPIAITGATGFIGKHLVRALTGANCRPVLLIHAASARDRSREGDDLAKHQIDLSNRASIRQALNEARPATIFHLAGTRGRGDHLATATACDELNFTATVRLLEEARAVGVRRIVIIGTAEEYGNQPGPLNESLPARAESHYGISKAKATSEALEMHAQHGFPVVVARAFSVYGPGQPSDMFIAEAVDCAVRNAEFRMTRGEQKRDLIYVEDVVRGLIAAASASGIEGQVINFGSGECHRLCDVAKLIWKLTNTTAPLLIGARRASDEELYDTWADITLAKRLLNWEPRVDLETGLSRTINFAREQLLAKTHHAK